MSAFSCPFTHMEAAMADAAGAEGPPEAPTLVEEPPAGDDEAGAGQHVAGDGQVQARGKAKGKGKASASKAKSTAKRDAASKAKSKANSKAESKAKSQAASKADVGVKRRLNSMSSGSKDAEGGVATPTGEDEQEAEMEEETEKTADEDAGTSLAGSSQENFDKAKRNNSKKETHIISTTYSK